MVVIELLAAAVVLAYGLDWLHRFLKRRFKD